MIKISSSLHKKIDLLQKYGYGSGIDSDQIDAKLRGELIYSLNQLVDSELSEAEVYQILENGIAIGGKNIAEQQRVLQLSKTISWLEKSSSSTKNDIREQFILDLHYLLFSFSTPDSELVRYTYKVPYVLTEYIEWLQQQDGPTPVVAVEAVCKLLESQLFSDQNTPRTAILLLNVLLIQEKLPLVHIDAQKIEEYKQVVQATENLASRQVLEDILLSAIEVAVNKAVMAISPEKPSSSELLKIGQLAKLTDQTVPTIRFWTKQGLLPVADHSQGGYQLYEKEVVVGLVLKIRALQMDKRLSIQEIKKLVVQ